jgi:hypothetical protein
VLHQFDLALAGVPEFPKKNTLFLAAWNQTQRSLT